MKTLMWCIGLTWLATLSAQAETAVPTADDWYQNQYAPHWKDKAWDKIDVFTTYYSQTIHVRESDGAIYTADSKPWLGEDLQEWQAEGWLGSDIAAYRSDLLNPTTATFKVKWRDWYDDGSEELSCGWYMADIVDGRWVFTQYADIDCAAHDL